MTNDFEFPEPNAGARERALLLTNRVLRRRRVVRRAAAVVILIAAYAAGWASHGVVDFAPSAPPPSAEGASPPPPAPSPLAARDLESQAVAAGSSGERASLLKAAGDRYLAEVGDVAAALRCYRELLTLASSEERTRFDPADSWLLTALKHNSD